MNIKTCWACHTGVKFQPITNSRGDIIATHSICRSLSCPMNQKDLTLIKLKQRKSTKHSVSVKRTTKRKSRFISGAAVGISSLMLTVYALTSYANFQLPSSEMNYTAQIASSTTPQSSEIAPQRTQTQNPVPESIHDKLTRYALKYDIPREQMHDLVQCEVGEMFNPNTRSQGILKTGKQENSWGLSQINLDVHDVKKSDAIDPDFALDWLGAHWSQRHQMYVNCTKKLGI